MRHAKSVMPRRRSNLAIDALVVEFLRIFDPLVTDVFFDGRALSTGLLWQRERHCEVTKGRARSMATFRPGGTRTGAWGSGNAAQSARRQDHGDHDGQGNLSIPEVPGDSRNQSEGRHTQQAAAAADQEADRPLAAGAAKGASIPEMQGAMGCQAHSVRGFLAATVKKMPGVVLTSEKTLGRPRRYHIEAAGE